MNDINQNTLDAGEAKRGMSGMKIFLIVLVTVLVTIGVTLMIVKYYFFPSEFKPVQLSVKEEQVLETKLERLESLDAAYQPRRKPGDATAGVLEPEAYSEEGAERSISLSEREINSLVAKNTDLARKLAIDLSDDMMSAKLLMPVDEDFPIMGGKILKVRAGVELAYRDDKPIVILKGVSVMGVPIPNAWLGGLKNIDLVEQFGSGDGFWKAFADGVQNISIVEGDLRIELKE
ncbi:MAG: arginine N-succinyltransferase [Gammaproteobacteria bacterium]